MCCLDNFAIHRNCWLKPSCTLPSKQTTEYLAINPLLCAWRNKLHALCKTLNSKWVTQPFYWWAMCLVWGLHTITCTMAHGKMFKPSPFFKICLKKIIETKVYIKSNFCGLYRVCIQSRSLWHMVKCSNPFTFFQWN